MFNFQDILQKIFIYGLTSETSKQIVRILKRLGVSDEEIREIDKYDKKFSWLLFLKLYITENCKLPMFIKNLLDLIADHIEDFELKNNMKDFLNMPEYKKAAILYEKIYKSLEKDAVQDFFKKVLKILNKLSLSHNMFPVSDKIKVNKLMNTFKKLDAL